MRLGHPVHTFRQHHTVLNNKAGKWPSTGLHIPFRQINQPLHEIHDGPLLMKL
jgi:hypothetical protein